ncbi:uncharacterized protein LOC132301569 [Cornus florida]|uniref:uncharacterized protein LOC132301569 n=1 Tax=Cornus florida TaxID=4283 RepID=UPI00289C7EA1|nr:uncharacterized protein LOC132301569 [Cornus florida]
MAVGSLPCVKALTGSNFSDWKDEIIFNLGFGDLDLAIRSDEPPKPTDTSGAEVKKEWDKWDRSNRLSLMYIKNNIPKYIKGAIPDKPLAKDYLKALEEHFTISTKSLASTLMTQLVTAKYDGLSGVREHIMKMTDIACQLKNLDMEVSDSFLIHFIMTSLPAQFDIFKTTYNAEKDKWN